MMKAAVIYRSKTGNTEKVARAIKEGLKISGAQVELYRPGEAGNLDFFDPDLVCVGFPSYRWHPPPEMVSLLQKKYNEYLRQDRVKTGAPRVPGKNVLVFCTYSGPHTGIREAIPAGKFVGQFFEHLGFTVLDEWYVIGEFHGSEEKSTQGPLGDTRGRPSAEDLENIKKDAAALLKRLGG